MQDYYLLFETFERRMTAGRIFQIWQCAFQCTMLHKFFNGKAELLCVHFTPRRIILRVLRIVYDQCTDLFIANTSIFYALYFGENSIRAFEYKPMLTVDNWTVSLWTFDASKTLRNNTNIAHVCTKPLFKSWPRSYTFDGKLKKNPEHMADANSYRSQECAFQTIGWQLTAFGADDKAATGWLPSTRKTGSTTAGTVGFLWRFAHTPTHPPPAAPSPGVPVFARRNLPTADGINNWSTTSPGTKQHPGTISKSNFASHRWASSFWCSRTESAVCQLITVDPTKWIKWFEKTVFT